MWEMYQLLGEGQGETYLFDEIIQTMSQVPSLNIRRAIGMMYDTVSINPLEIGLMFTKGLTQNHFFAFQKFIEAIRGNSSQQQRTS